MPALGEHGGRVLRHFPLGGGKHAQPGRLFSPDEVRNWPQRNRLCLSTQGLVEWFTSPAVAAEAKAQDTRKK